MPYPVKHLIAGRAAPVTISRDESLAAAWNLMLRHDYSQLPVVDSENRPLGMVTHERILRAVGNLKAQLSELHVRDAMIEIPRTELFDLDDDLFGLLKQLKLASAVLIVDQQEILVGIVTSYDSTEYFQNRAENLMRVEDVEAAVKDFILAAYTLPDGSRDEQQLAEAILQITPKNEGESRPLKTFDDLTLGQYVSLLTSKKTWSFFEPIFRVPRGSIVALLDDIRNTRNDLAHFRKEITIEQADQLRFCAEWLGRCWETYQQANSHNVITGQPMKMGETIAANETSQPNGSEKIEQNPEPVQIIAEEIKPMESKYAALADWLASQPGHIDTVRLSFQEIETIIGGPLPASAYEHRAWWANDVQGHPHSQLWLEAGWRTNYLNRTEKVVTFVRIQEREKAYIEFFSKLLQELRDKANFPIKQVSSDGTNWVVCQTIASPGFVVGQFNYSFARGNRFRVEMYMDTFNQETTKQVFDNLYAQRAHLENVLGELSWERIDDKRASRVALYHPGKITDSAEQLQVLRAWAVEKMIVFYNTLEPVAAPIFKQVVKS